MNIVKLEDSLKSIFQKDIQFKLNEKVLKEGKLILFSFKEFYLHFKLRVNNSYKNFEIPCPFEYTLETNRFVFDYTNKTFTKNNKNLEFLIKVLKKNKTSKYYNNHLIINFS